MDFKSVVEQSQYCRKQLRELIDSYYTVYEKDSSNQDKKIIIIRLRCLYLSYRRLLDSMDLHRYLSDECFLKKDMQFEYNSSSYEESKFEVIFHSFYTNITLAINQLRYLNNKFKENKEIQQIRVKHRKSIANIVRIRNLMTAHPMSEKL